MIGADGQYNFVGHCDKNSILKHESTDRTYWVVQNKADHSYKAIYKPTETNHPGTKIKILTDLAFNSTAEPIVETTIHTTCLSVPEFKASVIILNDQADCFIPIIRSEISTAGMSLVIKNGRFDTTVFVNLEMEVYQGKIGKWEPILERFNLEVELKNKDQGTEVLLKPADESPLNINVTPESHQIILKTIEDALKFRESMSRNNSLKNKKTTLAHDELGRPLAEEAIIFDSKFLIRNLSGETLRVAPLNELYQEDKTIGTEVEIAAEDERFINFKKVNNKQQDRTCIRVKIWNFQKQIDEVFPIDLEIIGSHSRALDSMKLKILVLNEGLKRVCIIRSQVLFCNKTDSDLIINYNKLQDQAVRKVIRPGEMMPVSCVNPFSNLEFEHKAHSSYSFTLANFKKIACDKRLSQWLPFYPKKIKNHRLRIMNRKVNNVRCLVLYPSFTLLNLCPLAMQFLIFDKQTKITEESLLSKNQSVDLYEFELERKEVRIDIILLGSLKGRCNLSELQHEDKDWVINVEDSKSGDKACIYARWSAHSCTVVFYSKLVI
jgi:hypothetical protein